MPWSIEQVKLAKDQVEQDQKELFALQQALDAKKKAWHLLRDTMYANSKHEGVDVPGAWRGEDQVCKHCGINMSYAPMHNKVHGNLVEE